MFVAVALPFAVLVVVATVPILSAQLLALLLLRGAPAAGEERARRLVGFRLGALVVGAAQLELAGYAAYSVARPLLGPRHETAATLFAALAVVVAFVAGGVGRRVEEPPGRRTAAWAAALLRLRFIPYVAGPLIVARAAAALPLVDDAGAAPVIRWPMVALAIALTTAGVAYGGLLLAFATGALVRAPPDVARLCHGAAEREGVRLWFALRLPTPGTRFANAAAVPWARTMVVSDGIRDALATDELDAVLAHEAGHLSEPKTVVAARLGSATAIMFAFTSGARIVGDGNELAVTLAFVAASAAVFLAVRRLARRMEERADGRARATVGAAPFARALQKIHAIAQAPMVTGSRRVHPDLADRLAALGVETGPRPPPPPRRRGLAVGLAIAGVLVGVTFGVLESSSAAGGDDDAPPAPTQSR